MTSDELPVMLVNPLNPFGPVRLKFSPLADSASRSNCTCVLAAAENVHWSVEYGVATLPVVVWLTLSDWTLGVTSYAATT